MFLSPCFRIEEVLVSPLTFAGVGKTVIAAFDYKRFKQANKLGQAYIRPGFYYEGEASDRNSGSHLEVIDV